MIIHNLTPHDLRFYGVSFQPHPPHPPELMVLVEGEQMYPVLTLPSEGFARCEETPVTGLPAPADGHIYVVSRLTAERVPEREDVFYPDDAVRDDAGDVVGCRALARPARAMCEGCGAALKVGPLACWRCGCWPPPHTAASRAVAG